MKNILRIALFSSAFFLGYMGLFAQSLEIIQKIEHAQGYIDDEGTLADEVKSYAKIKNLTSQSVTVKIKVEMVQLFEGHSVSVCLGNCFPPVTDDYIVPASLTILPGQITTDWDFYADYYPYNPMYTTVGTEGSSRIKFIIYVESNPEDKVEYYTDFEVSYITSVRNEDAFGRVTVSPNPANDFARVDLSNLSISGETEIEIFDLFGSKLIGLKGSFSDNVAIIDLKGLNSGRYFVRIASSNGINLVQPLIISK